jgi:two-component system CheB/CheR fusion protein
MGFNQFENSDITYRLHGLSDGMHLVGYEIAHYPPAKTAQYPDMPRNAITADTVYYVLPPEKMAEVLSRIAKHPEIIRPKVASIATESSEGRPDIRAIFSLLQSTFGVNFADYKQSTINRRISRRMILNQIDTIGKYVDYLRGNKEELQAPPEIFWPSRI